MASPPVLEIASLLQPVSEAAPAGTDLRTDQAPDSPYYKIKDARTSARAAERNEVGDQTGIVVPEWRTVVDLAPSLLGTHTKDLEIAAWLAEAMLRAEGFAGLRDAFTLAAGLVDTFWDGLYPTPDEDGVATRVAPLSGLNGAGGEGTLILPLRKAVLLHGSERPLAFWHIDKAIELAKLTDQAKKDRLVKEGSATMDEIQSALASTPPAAVLTMVEDVRGCQEAFLALEKALTAKCGNDAPPTSNIRSTLAQIVDTITYVAKDRLAMAQQSAAVAEPGAGEVAPAADGAPARGGPSAGGYSREAAFDELLRIAAFFRRTEPHSPISYTLEELVRRGRLPMPELLAELIPDAGARSQFFLVAGIKPPAAPG